MAETLLIKNASVLIGGAFARKELLIENGTIVRILDDQSASPANRPLREIDAAGLRALPGFIDIHTHGCRGVDFNRASRADLGAVCPFYASRGVASFLPTLSPDTADAMKRQLALLTAPEVRADFPQMRGVHLEGPFLSPQYKGALPEELFQPCGIERFAELQDAARGKIALVTLSPELDGAADLIRQLTRSGVRVSLGHSGASYEQAMDAIAAGAASATHTMNAMKMLHMHDPAILTAVLESDIYAEMICDGFHLQPPIVRLLLKIKGLGRMIAVTDSMMAAGFPDGRYAFGAGEVVVANGDAKLAANGVRAGSTLTMIDAVRNIQKFTGLGLESVSRLVSENPARMLGIFDETGSIAEGKRADLTLLDSDQSVSMTIVRGNIAYRKE